MYMKGSIIIMVKEYLISHTGEALDLNHKAAL